MKKCLSIRERQKFTSKDRDTGGGLSYTQTFGYDQLTRLTTSLEGASWSQTNSYDRYGNRTIVGGGLTFNAANNRITTVGYAYDAVGNLTSDNAHAYTFDAEAMPPFRCL